MLDQLGLAVLDDHRCFVHNPVASVQVARIVPFDASVDGLVPVAKNEHIHIGAVMGLTPFLGKPVEVFLVHGAQRPIAVLSAMGRPSLGEGDAEIRMDALECGLAQLGGEHAFESTVP